MAEVSSVRCRVCGRQLYNPISVAIGIGPKCAGGRPRGGGQNRARIHRPSHCSYASNARLTIQMLPLIGTTELTYHDQLLRLVTVPLTREQFRAELVKMKRGTKKELSQMRAGMLKARTAFCAGIFLMANGEQCKYEPVNQHAWREVHSQRAMESLDLSTYLKQIGVVAPERKV